ncbi:hypothetical protein CR152_10075 [Massilia violaceinigra]|uniref:Uncharacterized protein n=1 Tax=Massilia violaceinigra TaxID=2045208 RepID=A0A2D2DIN4_9BURK|nr:hypothetical protein [Massilia violaceinigra]ATQ74831.1 hypothetical protein CR152_10075 [Massilia violaceinigra]
MSAQHTQGRVWVKISNVLGDAWVMPAGANAENRMREVALVNHPADARRLAACWNAFDGMPIEHIESIPECGVNGLADYAADHKRECDRLRKELEAAGVHDELVRELDVMLNGRGALAPTLFDIVQQVRSEGITTVYPHHRASDLGGDEAAWRAFAETQAAELDRLDGGPLHKAWFDGLRHGRFTHAHLCYLAAAKGGAA